MDTKELQLLAEDLDQKRLLWLKISVAGYATWNSTRLIDAYLLVGDTNPILTGISLLGAFIWMVSLFQILQNGKKLKQHKLLDQIFNDELVVANRFKTWRFGLIAVTVTQFIFIISSFFIETSGVLVAEISLFVAVVSTLSAFIYYTGKDDE